MPGRVIRGAFAALAIVVACLVLLARGAEAGTPQIAAGSYHSVAIKADGTLWSWGLNANGQLGDGGRNDRLYPKQVGTARDWSVVAAGAFHTLAIKNDGTLWAWGAGGSLGDGTIVDRVTPTAIGVANDWRTVAAGSGHTLAIKSDGSLWAWGSNNYGQCGNWQEYSYLTPVQVGSDNMWSKVAAGDSYSIALKSDGTLWAWGSNSAGRSGTGWSPFGSNTPTRVGSDSDWIAISAGPSHALAVKGDGSLWTWGDGTYTPTRIGSDAGWAKIAAGTNFNAAVKSDGTLWTWGDNQDGQLGNGGLPGSTPTLAARDARWAEVAAGNSHVLGLESDVTFWAWGCNSYGQVGDATTSNKNVPTRVGVFSLTVARPAPGNGDVTSTPSGIACGSACSSLFDSDSTVTLAAVPDVNSTFSGWSGGGCSGTGVCSVLIDSAMTVSAFFTPIPYNLSVTKNGTGDGSVASSPAGISCGATCSSSFNSGSSVTLTATPDVNSTFTGWSGGGCTGTGACSVNVTAATNVTATFTAIPYIIVLTKDGTGSGRVTINPAGISCDATCSLSLNSGTWIALSATPDENSVFSGWSGGGCTGTAPCTLQINAAERITAVFTAIDTPTWKSIAGGMTHSVAVKADGTLWAWGSNFDGELGDGTTLGRVWTPKQVGFDSNWATVAASATGTVALKSDGTLWVWGRDDEGQLGDGTTTDALLPTQINSDTDWIAVSTCDSHTLALKANGTIWSWGDNTNGVLGDGTTTFRDRPSQIGKDKDWVALSTGNQHSVALKADGSLWSWGSNFYGQLGGRLGGGLTPAQVGTDSWSAVSAGPWHTIALKSDGTLWAWGENSDGQLGDGTLVGKSIPTQVGTDDRWAQVSAGGYFNLALKSDGTLWTWGGHFFVVFDEGPIMDKVHPRQVGDDNTWSKIAAGDLHALTLKRDGSLWTWGWNSDGQLGESIVNHLTPREIKQPLYNITVNNSGTGTGTIISTPSKLLCGTNCSTSYSSGASVMLTAKPDANSIFTGWSGACSGTQPTCVGTVNEPWSVTATFNPTSTPGPPTAITVTAESGGATVTFSPPGSNGGKPITSYTATANPGKITATGTSSPLTVRGLYNATAYTFTVAATNADGTGPAAPASGTLYGLEVTIIGSGRGSVNSDPAGINGTTGTLSGHFGSGSTINLFQTPSNGSQFGGWGGACTGTGQCGILMDSLFKGVTATFNVLPRARISGSPTWYGLLQRAYSDAATGAVILAKETTFSERLTLDATKTVTVRGGFDETLTTRKGFTVLDGVLLLRGGKLTVDHLKVK